MTCAGKVFLLGLARRGVGLSELIGMNWPKIPKVLSMHISITIKHILNTRVQLLL